ncbi:MAG TPA: MBL fold metallo-hydrolase [Candidatus Cloacimonadota bacterium]|nr:MBL fold metallo-hydrolase [Candidatus Cloacimonadota bacterium]HPS38484.1 MBL fold metallo-hydrolase [Candidatus Cloacimonadota bacterium]
MPKIVHRVHAGHYWSDGGALMGVLPWAIWGKTTPTDERRRQQMDLNLLLIMDHDRAILVDTGLGNRLSDKQKDIYQPSEFLLPFALSELGLRDIDITDVIMTHLHFDHAGGIVTGFGEVDRLTFPKAKYWIQKSEWNMAKNPDGLNQAAYAFDHQLALLESEGNFELLDGDAQICEGVSVKLVGGHTIGSQIVEIEAADGFCVYPGDIIATKFHTSPAITSAYDVNRKQTFEAKKYIYSRLRERQGYLLLDHDTKYWKLQLEDLKIKV